MTWDHNKCLLNGIFSLSQFPPIPTPGILQMKVHSVILCNVNCHLRNLCNENCNLRFQFRKFIGFVTLASLAALDRHWHLRRWTSIFYEKSMVKLSWYLVLWGEIGKKCCRREKMVHIFHNKETPLYKRFPDGWATKAKWKTLPLPIPPHSHNSMQWQKKLRR